MTHKRLPVVAADKVAGESSKESGSCSHGVAVASTTGMNGPAARDFSGNVALVTLGCAKNLVDSEVMLGALQRKGFRPVDDPANADLIVVNTCAFLESAVKEGIDTILELARFREEGRCRQLVVAGCMVERYRQDLEQSLPEVDRFISTDEILSIGDGIGTTAECFESARRPYFLYDETMPRVLATGRHSAFVKIAEGCDRPCAFCIIPKIRGAFRSRSESSVVAECEALLGQGAKELVFVAQDLTNYGADLSAAKQGSSASLLSLLRKLESCRSIQPDFWVRLNYAYPIGVNAELVRFIEESPIVCNYLDMPLQHIAHGVLKRMQRPLGERRTRELIEMIRTQAPSVALRTTFITGFPGETDADVEALRSYIEEGHFMHVGVFPYSQEQEAKSFVYPDQIEPKVCEERRKILMEAQQRVLSRRLGDFVGKRLRVLLEGPHPESDLLIAARAEFQGPETDGLIIVNELAESLLDRLLPDGTEILDSGQIKGVFGEVEIASVAGYDLVGTLISADDNSAEKTAASASDIAAATVSIYDSAAHFEAKTTATPTK